MESWSHDNSGRSEFMFQSRLKVPLLFSHYVPLNMEKISAIHQLSFKKGMNIEHLHSILSHMNPLTDLPHILIGNY